MVVNSVNFILFFIIVLFAYYIVFKDTARKQNWVLLLASYLFYGIADWRMIPLLFAMTIAFYYLAIKIERYNQSDGKRASRLTTLSVLLGLGVLGYFKYLNFFIDSFAALFNMLGFQTNPATFNIIMPLGVSFFTFKLISYVIEVHRGNMSANVDFVQFATYVSFFPTILSGPIDRPRSFVVQLAEKRSFDYAQISEGCKRIVWGMFKKMCVADVISSYTDAVFNNYIHHNATTIIVAAILYTFQLYADFSGYSDMAIGCGRILGINILENFRLPLFAVNIQEFWQRWHISLTTWLTDYVFTPLNVSLRSLGGYGLYIAIIVNLLSIGLWHGANWTFVLFGFYHGLCLVFDSVVTKRRKKFEKTHDLRNNLLYKYLRVIKMFIFVTLGFVLFRSDSIDDFYGFVQQAFSGFGSLFAVSASMILSLLIMIAKDWKDEENIGIHFLHSKHLAVKVLSFSFLLFYIICLGNLSGANFIYFQF